MNVTQIVNFYKNHTHSFSGVFTTFLNATVANLKINLFSDFLCDIFETL